ncbi:MAG: hypothetical protein ABIP35_17035 [Ginsengibacter sp.]
MELKKEPLDIDFVVDSRPLTKKEKIAISEFIKDDKAKRALKEKKDGRTKNTKKQHETV